MPKTTDLDTFAEAYAAGAPVIDVREPEEYAQAHLSGALLMPLATVPGRAHELDPDTTTYVICQAGYRSLQAVQALAAAGYDVVNVAGGMNGWIQQGRSYDAGPARQ